VEVRLLEPEGRIIMMGDPLVVEKGESASGTFLAVLGKSVLNSSNTKLVFGVYSNDELIEKYEVTFIGPASMDKKAQ
jgi:hypothetical protein